MPAPPGVALEAPPTHPASTPTRSPQMHLLRRPVPPRPRPVGPAHACHTDAPFWAGAHALAPLFCPCAWQAFAPLTRRRRSSLARTSRRRSACSQGGAHPSSCATSTTPSSTRPRIVPSARSRSKGYWCVRRCRLSRASCVPAQPPRAVAAENTSKRARGLSGRSCDPAIAVGRADAEDGRASARESGARSLVRLRWALTPARAPAHPRPASHRGAPRRVRR